MNIPCHDTVEPKRPDIILVNRTEKKCINVDTAILGDSRIHEKEFEKVEKYQDLEREITRMWIVTNVEVDYVLCCQEIWKMVRNLGVKVRIDCTATEYCVFKTSYYYVNQRSFLRFCWICFSLLNCLAYLIIAKSV